MDTKNIRQNWPMSSYLRSWQLFRELSDENQVTTEALISHPNWPRKEKLHLLDIGCGDGKLVRKVLTQTKSSHQQVTLLDPDDELLRKAEQEVESLREIKVSSILAIRDGIGEMLPTILSGVDVILAVHVVYLVDLDVIHRLISDLPPRVPVFIVLDKPGSVFSTLWKSFASDFLQRVEGVHQYVSDLDRSVFHVESEVIRSKLVNPLQSASEQVRDSLISMLCYDDARDMTVEALDKAKAVIEKFSIGPYVPCDSTCYMISRKLDPCQHIRVR